MFTKPRKELEKLFKNFANLLISKLHGRLHQKNQTFQSFHTRFCVRKLISVMYILPFILPFIALEEPLGSSVLAVINKT